MAYSIDSILDKKIVHKRQRLILIIITALCFIVFFVLVIFAKNIAPLFGENSQLHSIVERIRVVAFLLLFVSIGFAAYLYQSTGRSGPYSVTVKEQAPFDLDWFGQGIIDRIKKEIDRLKEASFLNLSIGAVITAIGLVYLIYVSTLTELTAEKITIQYLLLRLSIVVFVEIFAFFFLRMYRANQNDIKYFNNEMTNVEFLLVSIHIAKSIDEAKERNRQVDLCLKRLLKIERNFILKKNETTVDIQKDKMEVEANKSIIEVLQKTLSSIKFGKDE